MKKNLFFALLISLKTLGQAVTIVPSSSTSTEFLKIKKNGIGLDHRTANGLVGVGTYANDGGGFIQTHTNHPLYFATNNGTEQITLNTNGYVGIGLTVPNQILDVNGRMRIRHKTISSIAYTSGIWMSNSTNSLSDADGAFYGMINDTQAGIYIGNAWRFAVNSNGNIVNTGFTQLGNTVPAGAAAGATAPTIKVLKLIGTTASTQGTSVSVNHGIPGNKILDYQVIVNQAGTNGVPPNYTVLPGFLYNIGSDSGAIYVANAAGNSANILSKPFRVYITYEE